MLKLLSKAEAEFTKASKLQKAIAKQEATISREENQKVRGKSKKHSLPYVKKFQTYNSYLRILKTTYK